jgi:uncharacterized protein (DUF1015 family)
MQRAERGREGNYNLLLDNSDVEVYILQKGERNMAIVKPFKGLRPIPDKVKEVASPPYDVISSDEAREVVEKNPLSFLRVIRPEVDLPQEIDLYDERVYKKGKENLDRFIGDGILIQDSTPCLYIYRQVMGDHIQVGLVACASVDEYEKGVIKKHEHTREEKEIDRTKHIESLNAQASPVFLTYRSNPDVDVFMLEGTKGEPVYDFTADDGVRHTFWVIDNPDTIETIMNGFRGIDYMYVADGHHRSAAAVRVRNRRKEQNPNHTGEEDYNYFLVVIFPHTQLKILDYNRVVKDTNGLNKEELLKKIKERFIIEAREGKYKPSEPHTFGMFFDKRWYKLTAKEGTFPLDDPVESLDVAILQENLLAPILGIVDPRKDKRISFIGGIKGIKTLEDMVNEGEYTIAFAMYPTNIESLMRVADAEKVMPPKSTWFEPKLRSGIVIHLIV